MLARIVRAKGTAMQKVIHFISGLPRSEICVIGAGVRTRLPGDAASKFKPPAPEALRLSSKESFEQSEPHNIRVRCSAAAGRGPNEELNSPALVFAHDETNLD